MIGTSGFNTSNVFWYNSKDPVFPEVRVRVTVRARVREIDGGVKV